MSAAALSLAERGFDLLMLYLRNVDAESHPHWKYFQQPQSTEVEVTSFAHRGQLVANAYRAVDRVLGELRVAAAPETNFFVVSDHGFRAVKQEQYRIELHLDRILEHLGYLERAQGEVDWSRSRAAPWGSTPGLRRQPLRFGRADRQPGGPVAPGDVAALRERLTADLNQVTYESGMPALRVREPGEDEREKGADLIVLVRQKGVTRELEFRGQPIPDAIGSLRELTGTHDANTEGIFLAAGPDIDRQSAVELVHSLDIAPTLLYELGLPIAQDFDGRPQTELFNHAFRRRYPVRSIPSWGTRETGSAISSGADEQLLEELRALGYLD